MFDLFSWNHILILLIVALVVVGPKDLPRLMHMMGRWAGKARGMANEFKRSFDDMARQSELDELRKEVEALRANNPLSDIQKSMEVDPFYGDNSAALDEPRAGEFQVTDSLAADMANPEPAAPAATAPEPAPAAGSERAAS